MRSSSMRISVQYKLYKIHFVIFGHFYEFLLIFKMWNPFWYLKQLKRKEIKPIVLGLKVA
jgi:hypothetical protein